MKGRQEAPKAPKRGCRGGGCPAEPSTPASTAFPSSLNGFCHDSAWPRVIYSSLGPESKVLEPIPQILVSAVRPLPEVFPAVGGQDRLEELHTLLPAHPTACAAPSPTRVAEQFPPERQNPAQLSRNGPLETPTGCPQNPLSTPALSPIGAAGASGKARSFWPFPNIYASIVPSSGEMTSQGNWLGPAKLVAHGALQEHSPCCPPQPG